MSHSPRPIAALTGATGFLGVHLVRALDEAGFAVRALARRAPSAPGWGEVRPQVVTGDLSDPETLARLVEGVDAVVHCAGAIKAPDLSAFMAVNRDAALRLGETAKARAPEAPFVLVSSLAARSPGISAYAASKRAGEDALAQALGERLTIVRPPAIYGPGDRETLTIFQAVAKSPVLPILSAEARLALIHVEDAATAIAGLARTPAPGLWALSDIRPEGYAWREILRFAADAVGRRPLLIRLPGGLTPALAKLGVASRLLSRDKAGEILHKDWAINPSDLPPTGRNPRWDLASGFASTVEWYREAGWMGKNAADGAR